MSVVTDVAAAVLEIANKFIPDPAKKLELAEEAQKMAQAGELAQLQAATELAKGQLEVNKAEAGSNSLFVSGGRPAIIWVGAISLACYYIPYALISTAIWAYECVQSGHLLPRPDMGITDLLGLLTPMLGVSWMRHEEKKASAK